MKKGDLIIITNSGSVYSSHSVKAKEMNADLGGKWVQHRQYSKDDGIAKILNIKGHFLLIETLNRKQFLIGKEGVEPSQAEYLEDSLFEI